jgi:hypothetical protein
MDFRKYKLKNKKDKFDSRNYLAKDYLRKVAVEPDSVDMSKWCAAVSNQGSNGACTGHAIGGLAVSEAIKLGLTVSISPNWFSQWWFYNGARFIEGSLLEDAGAYPQDVFDWWKKKGALPYSFWPYTDKFDTTSPPSKFDKEAAKWPLASYVRVTDGSAGIISALAAGHFVAIGIPWPDQWFDCPVSGNLPIVTKSDFSLAGGHELFVYGYDKPSKKFLVQNSWGIDYGNKGHCRMQMNAFDGIFQDQGGYDAHVATVNWGSTPPTPTGKTYIWLRHSTDNVTWNNIFKGEYK